MIDIFRLKQHPNWTEPTANALGVNTLVRRRTGHKDKYGKNIYSNHVVGSWFSAPWDEQHPIFIEFKIEKRDGRWWCYSTSDNDNYLSEFKNLEILRAV